MSRPLLSVDSLHVHYGRHPVLRGVSFSLAPGETLGIVGESGSGKSTLARAILKLVPASAGRIAVLGRELGGLARAELRPLKRDLQLVFQDPLAALNPRMTVGDI